MLDPMREKSGGMYRGGVGEEKEFVTTAHPERRLEGKISYGLSCRVKTMIHTYQAWNKKRVEKK